MPTIDVQVHVYERNHPGRPWVGALHGPPEVTGDDMVKAMDAVGVDGAIIVSIFAMYRFDASYAVSVRRAHPTRFALVKPVDTQNPAVEEVVADWAKTDGTVGIRIMMNDELTKDPDDPGINRTLAARRAARPAGEPAVLGPAGAGRGNGGEASRHAPGHRPSRPSAALRTPGAGGTLVRHAAAPRPGEA
jgi:hypothetical protein